jgi:hypothetical protein
MSLVWLKWAKPEWSTFIAKCDFEPPALATVENPSGLAGADCGRWAL